jgi:glycosyltransferase involved in cell wall biosynthesis
MPLSGGSNWCRALVAAFAQVPGPTRAGAQIPHVLRALARRFTVEALVARRGDQAYVEQDRRARFLRVPIPDGAARDRAESFRRALRRQLEGAEYDVVHCCDSWSATVALELRERLRFQVVFDATRGPLAAAPPEVEELAQQIARDEDRCVEAADLVLAPTEAAARYLAERGGGDRVRLAPVGVDVDAFDWEPGADHGPARIFFAGSLGRGRGIATLLSAMVEVAKRADVRLVLAGAVAPRFAAELASAIEECGLTDRVDLLGVLDRDELPSALAQATICVAPAALELSRRPTALYPTKILEYMACRRVVVAPRRGTVTMLVTDGEHGLLFGPGDATDLAAQILRLLGDAGLRERLARAGYERVRQAHTASAARRAVLLSYRLLEPRLPRVVRAEPAGRGAVETDLSFAEPPTVVTDAPLDDVTHVELAPSPAALVVDDTTEAQAEPADPGASGSGPVVPATGAAATASDPWVVAHGPLARVPRSASDGEDTDGTPVEVSALAVGADAAGDTEGLDLETRFAAGELVVDTPVQGTRPSSDRAGFTAASVLLSATGSEPARSDEE